MQTAIFDLDGTITRHDTLIAYIAGFLAQRGPLSLLRFVRTLPALVAFLAHRDRGRLKSAVIRATLGGVHRLELARWTTQFVDRLLRTGMHESALLAIAQHRRSGDALILLSASPDLYVPEIAARLGFSRTICTGVRWYGDQLDGALTTHNRRGQEKARCVSELRAQDPAGTAVAYGNAASDIPHLRLVDRGVLVNARGALRTLARDAGIECVDWR